jgi:hypothetical protein
MTVPRLPSRTAPNPVAAWLALMAVLAFILAMMLAVALAGK